MNNYTKNLADYAVKLKYDDLPGEVVEQAKLLTLHTLGVALAACVTKQGKDAIALAKEFGGKKPEATLLGDGTKVSAIQAGFTNGTLSDILDWEDCSWTGHPSSNAIPAALAMGEVLSSSGRDYITAVVAGYELYERIAMAVQPSEKWDVVDKGWGLSSWVIYASAIATAKMLGLNKEQIENVIGMAGALTPISNPRVHRTRTDFYHYQWGMNCLNGIAAAYIGKQGITPFPDFLDGESGHYWMSMADKCDWDWFNKDLGKRYLIMETYFKHWPTNMWVNQPLDGLDAIRTKYQVKPEDVDQIIVRPEIQFRWLYKPEGYSSIVDAEFSIPYCLAVLMYESSPGPNWYTSDKLNNSKIVELAGRIKAQGPVIPLNKAFIMFREGDYPPCAVEVKTKDGKVHKEEVPYPKGHPKNRLTIDEFKDRFRRTASFVLEEDKIEKAIDKILHFEDISNVSEVVDTLHN